MKHLTNANDIYQANEIMCSDKEMWGQGYIVNEGIILWNMFHNKLKDMRKVILILITLAMMSLFTLLIKF
ncbi:hypothetical protein [Neobacillus sp. LXY-1]|uniref:hypothetical protein n=1 Tax=Neobacillus sp. LXY-1 TaxID=3379133 RepID=UPI003EE2138B